MNIVCPGVGISILINGEGGKPEGDTQLNKIKILLSRGEAKTPSRAFGTLLRSGRVFSIKTVRPYLSGT
ncbi:hypothetical protein GMD88_14105 [Pseudoflavonifractor sp. BIOML-A6]|nr:MULTISPECIES: hypothetical protein [unclassified Pseudoflavonifractor]MTQ97354.1 hypothetical protein [Pseudoflavonifractor sp. BIOML-A16]MTR06384.1 hypothetical protein [Pseudoflavonifractor sp. BIOML-A15]MTR31659.1 hypothetical protein [Pseudoflavonifractor sp. BIOML-A14]MTR72345.1 hypothetical protein [Pseudoflavonifractor sp. BIOML-A18]MTS64231.1 hypothetical protein [Pseudoflavonifractor sp. BIOML-A5]MTS70747.1 hypothetical protein [Pseudoflavonifractor sp. BIOML-A8]MTS82974.1 hypoth